MGEVAGHVWECEVFRAKELDRRTFEETVVLFTDISGVF